MDIVVEVLILGFLISSLYALAALGFTMIFGVAGVLNLGHGAFVLVGGYLAVWMSSILPWNDFGEALLSAAFAIVCVAALAPLVYAALIRPVSGKPIIVLLATLLLAVITEQIILLVFGAKPRALMPMVPGHVEFLGVKVQWNRLVASLLSIGSIVALWLYITKTRHGKAISALSMERVGAALVGINEYRIQLIVWAVSGALAAVAGVFLTSFLGTSPFGGRVPLVISFSIVVLGGMGSIPGSLWAAYIIGFAETITTQFIPEARGLPSLILLLLILIVRPQGLFGRSAA